MPLTGDTHKRLSYTVTWVDALVSVAAYLLAFELISRMAPSLGAPLTQPKGVTSALLAVVIAVTLVVRRSNTSSGLIAGLDLYSTALKNSFAALTTASLVAFVLNIEARWLLLGLLFVLPTMLLVARWCLRQVLRFSNKKTDSLPTALLVGVHLELEATLKQETALGYRPVSLAAVASPEELESAIRSHKASALVLDRNSGTVAELRELVWRAEELGCRVMLASPLGLMSPNDVVVIPTATHDLTVLASASLRPAARFAKRVFDLLLTPLVIVLVSPVLLLAMVAVAIFDGFPVFYRASRIGASGTTFTMSKLRTMRSSQSDASEVVEGSSRVLTKDVKGHSPRITQTGRILRRWSIDELPQLFHVISGTMSLVGPRPRLPQEHDHDPLLLRRLKVKPGVTGLWQVSGRGDTPLSEAAELDVRYVDSWSLFGDVVILLRTIKTVATGRGAR